MSLTRSLLLPRTKLRERLAVLMVSGALFLVYVMFNSFWDDQDTTFKQDANMNGKLCSWTQPCCPDEAVQYMKTIDELQKLDVVIRYSNFTKPVPLFASPSDQLMFSHSKLAQQNLLPPQQEELQGRVMVIPNGTVVLPHECGYKSDYKPLLKPWDHPTRVVNRVSILCPLLVPDGATFQHFVDGTLPKLIQALEVLKRQDVQLLMEKPRDVIVYDILKKLGISENRLIYQKYTNSFIVWEADHMIYTCVTPPLSPELWHKARQLLGVTDHLAVPRDIAKVILLTRAGAENAGRKTLNQYDVEQFLYRRYGYYNNVVIFNGSTGLQDVMKTFSEVKLIIGVHGGSFYNMYFAPKETTLIEFVPIHGNGSDVVDLPAQNIFWNMAAMIGQPYWRVPYIPINDVYDMNMDISKLKTILDQVDSNMDVKK